MKGFNKRSARAFLASTAIGIFASINASAAWAQAEPADDGGLTEIVVTAQKREQSLQKVPATITALGSDALETRQIDDVASLQTQVPSLVVGAYYGTSLITLRGISTGLTSGAEDPSVATHINGVYQPRSRSVDSAMADLDRVEVLSGPQGTLYGRNATGGVINYILKRPSNSFEGEVTGSAGNYERFGVKGRVTGPLAENVNVLVSGLYDYQGTGYTKNLQPGAQVETLDRGKSVGGRFALDVGDRKGINAQFDAIYLDTRNVPVVGAYGPPDVAALGVFLGQQSFLPHESYSAISPHADSKYFQASATINFPLSDNISLKSITGYQTFKENMLIDLDAAAISSVEIDQRVRTNTFTQEFNLNGDLLNGKLKSLVGLFYYHDDIKQTADTTFNVPGFAALFGTTADVRSKSYSAFTDHTFSVTDRLRLQAGVRFNHDEKVGTTSVSIGNFALCPISTQTRKWDAWTPKFGAQFDASDGVMLYGQWSKGFKAGGFTANSCADDYDPESIKGPEFGIKTKLFDNHVQFNLSGYYYQIANLQVQKTVDVGTFFTLNAAEAEIYGAEFSLTALLAPGLQFDASGMVQSAKYKNFLNCNETEFFGACGSSDPRPVGARETDVSGNWLNRAAPYSLNLGLQYALPVAGGELLLRGESYFSGRVHYSEFPSAQSTQEAYSLQNAYLTFTPAGKQFTLRAYIKNIGNTDYKRAYFYNSAVRQATGSYGTPRTFGAEATVRF